MIKFIQLNWAPLLFPWIRYLVEGLAFSEDRPSTPAEVEALDKTLWVVPLFLSVFCPLPGPHIFHEKRIDFGTLQNMTPDFHLLAARTWFKVVNESHPVFVWGAWTSLLHLIFMCCDQCSCGVHTGFMQAPSPFGRWDPENGQLGHLFVRHINRTIPFIASMDADGLTALHGFLMLFDTVPGGGMEAITSEDVMSESLSALIRLSSRLLRKCTVSQDDADFARIHTDITEKVLSTLELLMYTWYCVTLALDAGLITVFLKASARHSSLPGKIEAAMRRILGRVSQYLVYPAVLHAFLRVERKITGGELEEKMRVESTALCDWWKFAVEKAVSLRHIRRGLKSKGIFWKCDNTDAKHSPAQTGTRFFSCTGCCHMVRLLLDVQSQPQRLTTNNYTGPQRLVPEHVSHFLRCFVAKYVAENAIGINSAVTAYVPGSATSSKHEDLVKEHARNPLVALDFSEPGSPSMGFPSLDSIIRVTTPTEFDLEFYETWSRTTSLEVLVLALFRPVIDSSESRYIFGLFLPFPLVPEEVGALDLWDGQLVHEAET
ncbi:hypothetical protein V5O48_009947 [Marasmius crinis-equi]